MTLQLAHLVGSGGSLEEVALGVSIIFLGLAFLVQRSLNRWVSIVMLAIGVAGVIATFTVFRTAGSAGTLTLQGQDVSVAELRGSVAALCGAREAAADGDAEGAQRAFLDRAHGPLHTIAAAVQDDDRDVVARLLEAKAKVEEGFIDTDDARALARPLDDLVGVTVEALAVLDIRVEPC